MNMSKAIPLLAPLLFAFTPGQGDAPGRPPANGGGR
jgi:hypothetical protein